MAAHQCPICKKEILQGEAGDRYRPFCSRRCAWIDLGRWLTGGYAIAVVEEEEEDEATPPEEPPAVH